MTEKPNIHIYRFSKNYTNPFDIKYDKRVYVFGEYHYKTVKCDVINLFKDTKTAFYVETNEEVIMNDNNYSFEYKDKIIDGANDNIYDIKCYFLKYYSNWYLNDVNKKKVKEAKDYQSNFKYQPIDIRCNGYYLSLKWINNIFYQYYNIVNPFINKISEERFGNERIKELINSSYDDYYNYHIKRTTIKDEALIKRMYKVFRKYYNNKLLTAIDKPTKENILSFVNSINLSTYPIDAFNLMTAFKYENKITKSIKDFIKWFVNVHLVNTCNNNDIYNIGMEMDIYGFIMLEKDFKKYDNIVYWVGNQHNEIIKHYLSFYAKNNDLLIR